jgi:hypothetical protein
MSLTAFWSLKLMLKIIRAMLMQRVKQMTVGGSNILPLFPTSTSYFAPHRRIGLVFSYIIPVAFCNPAYDCYIYSPFQVFDTSLVTAPYVMSSHVKYKTLHW